MKMSEYIDETSLTDEEVAAAIAEAKARKAERAKKAAEQAAEKAPEEKPKLEKAKTLDEESSEALLDASSSAAELEEKENESPAVRSAKSFSEAFAAAKKKRELDLLKKKEESKEDEAEYDDEDESEEEFEEDEEEAVFEADDEEEYVDEDETEDEDDESEEEFDDDEEEYDEDDDAEEYEEDDESEDDEEYEYDEDEDDELSGDGIFETDDENGEYNTTVNVDEDKEDDYDEEDEEEDEEESTFSTKTKIIIGVVIALLVIAVIAAFAFFLKDKGGNETSSVVSVIDGEITSVKFAEPSVSLEVGETVSLKLIVEPENAKDKTFKLKSNDETIVKVNEQGQITGISSGSTTVTATLKSNPTMTASLVVNVIDEEQSTLNIYNKFVNSIIDGTTDIDPEPETDSDSENEEDSDTEEDTEKSSDSDSDTDSEAPKKRATHKLTGNKIDDFDSDGEIELALYYEPTTDNEEPLVRIFHLVDEDAVEEETDSEEELEYDEFGNPIERDTESEAPESKPADSDKKKKSPTEKTLLEVEQYSELYMTLHTALEADAATEPWNTSYLEVKENETVTPRVKILSSGYGAPTYTYECDNEEIATVDKQGNIKGLKPGTVIVTVSSPLNSEAVAKVKIRVKDDTDLLDDYLAEIPVVNNTNDAVFPTETLIGKAIVDIDNDGVSELMLRFRYSDNVETVNIVKIENEKCVCYKTYNNLSDLYEYDEGDGSYSNSVLIHYTTGKVCLEYKSTIAKSGSKSRSTEEKIFTLENGGSLSELVNFRTTTDISTKTVTSEATVDRSTSSTRSYDEDDDDETDSEYEEEPDSEEDTNSRTSSYVDEDEDGYDDNTGEYFGSYAGEDGDIDTDNGIDLTNKRPVKKLPEAAGAPDDEDDDYGDGDNETEDYDDDEPTTSTVTTEVSEETTKYFVNGTPTERSVYEEILTRYSSTYSVWNAWESVY